MSAATHYERLGVDETASTEEIRRAYRRMARRLHPDANRGNPSANRQFGEVTDAYRTLSDPELRAGYDASLNGEDLDDETVEDDPARSPPGDAGSMTDEPAPGFGWGEPEAQTSFARGDASAGSAPHDAPSARAADRTAMGWHDAPRAGDWGEPTPWEGNPSLDAARGMFGVWPDDILLGTADRVTQAVCVAPVVWIAGLAMDASVLHLWRRLVTYRDASSAAGATDWERTHASGDLLATTGRVSLVLVVAILTWLVAGRTLRRQTASLPRRRGWWRSPGWYGVARLIRVASFVGCASLATTVLLLPTFADHARAHEAAADVADAPADQAAQLEDAYRSAKGSAASGNWRVVLWLGILPTAWIASGRLPARFGYYSQLDAV